MESNERLPDGWIRKESSKRPNQFYYFNTKTGSSQWTPPSETSQETVIHGKSPAKERQTPASVAVNENSPSAQDRLNVFNTENKAAIVKRAGVESENRRKRPSYDTAKKSHTVAKKPCARDVSAEFIPVVDKRSFELRKINDKSKSVLKKKSKTPAQDRLRKYDAIKDILSGRKGKSKTPAQDRIQKYNGINVLAEQVKTLVDPKSTAEIPSNKRKLPFGNDTAKHRRDDAIKAQLPKNDNELKIGHPITIGLSKRSPSPIAHEKIDDIPALFSKKSVQNRLSTIPEQSVPQNGILNDAISVFSNCFGFGGVAASAAMDEDEEMDWQPAEYSPRDAVGDCTCIVPDTNVLLDSLVSVKSVLEKGVSYVIMIPVIVLQELDKLKHNRGDDLLKTKATRAIRYIYDELKAKNPRLRGQKATDDQSHIINVKSPDDKILNCCLQLKGQSKTVTLVTNDINLSNKAILNDITAITSKQCLEQFSN